MTKSQADDQRHSATPDAPGTDDAVDQSSESAESDASQTPPNSSANTAEPAAQVPSVAAAGQTDGAQLSTELLVVGDSQVEIQGLAPAQVQELKLQYAKGMLDIQRKATDLKVDVGALEHTLNALTSETEAANKAGLSITATHAQSTSIGRTEVIIGNTGRAARGRLSRTQAGDQEDNNLMYAGLAAAVVLVVVLAITIL